jgi:septum formation topological specificity factor MinE
MSKLGYTWYAKDWRSNMNVSDLTLQEKGFYRELIDECFIRNSSKIQLNERTFCRLHGINSRTFTKVLQKLHESLLIVIENYDDVTISIPSTIKRLGVIEQASSGGKAKAISSEKKSAKLKEKEKENIIEENGFDLFWDLYDKKAGKKDKIEKKWNTLSDSVRKEILEYIPKYIKAQPDKKYRKNPDTFLNNESWNDELISDQSTEPKKMKAPTYGY